MLLKDMYMDTPLMFERHAFPQDALGATNPEHKIIERAARSLDHRWERVLASGSVVCRSMGGTWRDREFQGGFHKAELSRERLRKVRPEVVIAMRDCFEFKNRSNLQEKLHRIL